MICPMCKKEISFPIDYCGYCGADLAIYQKQQIEKKKRIKRVKWSSSFCNVYAGIKILALCTKSFISPLWGIIFSVFFLSIGGLGFFSKKRTMLLVSGLGNVFIFFIIIYLDVACRTFVYGGTVIMMPIFLVFAFWSLYYYFKN
jgi:hypothetical protein